MEKTSIEDFAWLAGTWASTGAEAGSGETWTEPAGGTMFGVARSVKNSQTVAFEYLRIVEMPGGSLDYVAMPSGRNETRFTLLSYSDKEAVFQNLQHDYPHRIIYCLKEDGSLLARIEGVVDGEDKSMELPMQKLDE
ncbi:hypothetical protein H8E52_03550 [bacterium]|nr:hypothetical protein [bacterium]